MTAEEIRELVLSAIREFEPSKEIKDETDLFSAGIIDSLSLLRFILTLEEKFENFDLMFSEANVLSPEFRKFSSLCVLIERKLQ